jgi:hypothetical protein
MPGIEVPACPLSQVPQCRPDQFPDPHNKCAIGVHVGDRPGANVAERPNIPAKCQVVIAIPGLFAIDMNEL